MSGVLFQNTGSTFSPSERDQVYRPLDPLMDPPYKLHVEAVRCKPARVPGAKGSGF